MKVTFDSNTYRRVVDPSAFRKDPRLPEFQKIHDAIKNDRIKARVSETLATLEGIQNAQRGQYFSAAGTSGMSRHPGLNPVVQRWREAAIALGVRFMRAPRIGLDRPPELQDSDFVHESDQEQSDRINKFMVLCRDLEGRGVGRAVLKGIGRDCCVNLSRG